MKNILFSCMLLMHAFNYSMDPDELLFPESNPHFFPATKVLNVYRLPISLAIPERLSSLFASVQIDEVPAYLIEAVQEMKVHEVETVQEIKKTKPEMSIGKKLLCLQEEPVDKKSYFSHLPGELLKRIYTILMKNNFGKKKYTVSLETFIRAMDYGIKWGIAPNITNKKRLCLYTGKGSIKNCCKLDDMLDAAEVLKKNSDNLIVNEKNNSIIIHQYSVVKDVGTFLNMLNITYNYYPSGGDCP